MGLLSSTTLIKGHAFFLFILAVYLTRSPEVVTESDVVFMLGEVLQIVRSFILPSLSHSLSLSNLSELNPTDRLNLPAGCSPVALAPSIALRALRDSPRCRRPGGSRSGHQNPPDE